MSRNRIAALPGSPSKFAVLDNLSFIKPLSVTNYLHTTATTELLIRSLILRCAWEAFTLITLFLRYTIDPNKLSDIAKYSADEQIPIRESGGKILGYFIPTDFAGATNEAIGLIDFHSLAEYEIYRAKLAAHPFHKKCVEVLQSTGALLSIHRSLVQRVESSAEPKP
jgi:hypothetical protein